MIIKKQIRTNNKEELINITELINNELSKNNINEGNILVFIPHTTAGITINENADPSVKSDIIHGLKSLELEKCRFSHMEGNSPAHIKSSLFGSSVNIIINNSKLMLGVWQGVYFCEFDGPRNREFIIQINS